MPAIKPASFHRALDVCWELRRAGGDIDKPVSASASGVTAATAPGIIAATAGRTEQTYEAVLHLATSDYSQQGAMLIRGMFEDVAVTHWLLLHMDEAEHYTGRFIRHRDAMRLALDRVAERYGAPRGEISDIKPNEVALISEFGRYAEHSWWGRDAQGNAHGLPQMVEQIGTAQQFWGRTHGKTPVFRETYDLVNKWANQFLHHTAWGITPVHVPGSETATIAGPRPIDVISRAYYLYAMMICGVLDANNVTPQTTPFWAQFMDGFPILVRSTGADE
jgi:hypothetical protein